MAIILISCSREDKTPVLTTTDVTNITSSTASGGGNITNDGGATITARGVCWSIKIDPTIKDNKTSDGTGAGSFSSSITGLNCGTGYFLRAYATNSFGTGYGMTLSIKTTGQSPCTPIVTTGDATNFQTGKATLNGNINPNGSSASVTFEYGTTTNYGNSIPASQSLVVGELSTNVNAVINGLAPNTNYHYRLKAQNTFGISFGTDKIFKLDCMVCKMVNYENGIVINSGNEATYCGSDLENRINIPPVTVGSLTTKVECTYK